MPLPVINSQTGNSSSLALSWQALRQWRSRQVLASVLAAAAIALVIGFATVLIPNSVFARDIPPVWWNYPVWILTSVLSGMLLATYVAPDPAPAPSSAPDPEPGEGSPSKNSDSSRPVSAKGGRLGMAGGILAWFAVGCPVCNKIALLALGYAGAISWFAPLQPFLAALALVLTAVALVWRLRGQIICPVGPATKTA